MKDYKVLLYKTEGFDTGPEQAWLDRRGIKNVHLLRLDGAYEDFLCEAKDAHGVIVNYTQMTREVMAGMPRCQAIAAHSIGINQVDLPAATELGICVGNVPDYCIEDVATHTVSLFLNGVRKISQLNASVQRGEWNVYAGGPIHRVGGKTYGFVSFGNIPRCAVELLRPFGLQFAAFDPFVDDAVFRRQGVRRVHSLKALFELCDYISVHTPLTKLTHHMINADILSGAKEGLLLLALGRGGVIDEAALKAALEKGKISAAGMDVLENEDGASTVLRGMENVTLTPHAAYYSEESLIEVREKALMQVCEVLLDKKPPTYLVNQEVLGRARYEKPQI